VQAVKTGVTSGDNVEVVTGLTAGDQVVVDGVDQLKDGAKVSVTDAAKAAAATDSSNQPANPEP
jgi:multidrug efflux system membrane fusion protein